MKRTPNLLCALSRGHRHRHHDAASPKASASHDGARKSDGHPCERGSASATPSEPASAVANRAGSDQAIRVASALASDEESLNASALGSYHAQQANAHEPASGHESPSATSRASANANGELGGGHASAIGNARHHDGGCGHHHGHGSPSGSGNENDGACCGRDQARVRASDLRSCASPERKQRALRGHRGWRRPGRGGHRQPRARP